MFKNKYRIVTDSFDGYEAQVKYWFFPLMWLQIGVAFFTNTSRTVEEAERIIKGHRSEVVKYVD